MTCTTRLTLGALLLMTGCGGREPDVSDSLKVYVAQFMAAGCSHSEACLDNYYAMESIKEGPTRTKRTLGTCYSYKDGTPVNIVVAVGLTETVRDMTTMHELAHCLLGIEHSGDPESLMHPTATMSETYYVNNKDLILRRLFQ